MQMLVSSLACEQALGQPLAECAVVFLATGEERAFQWDKAARRQGVERVSTAMEALMRGESPSHEAIVE
jgi:hypothetical protein